MSRTYLFKADGRSFVVKRARILDLMPSYDGRGNPLAWFSWEQLEGGEKSWLAVAVKTMREAQAPINKLCGITG